MTITSIASLGQNVKENQSVASGALARVIGAIKTASQQTGVDFAYLMNKASQESGFRPDVKAKTSSATGLYQFTEQTWLRMVHDNGDKYGVGILASKIEQRPDGTLTVKDPTLRQQILELRKNPEMASSMAAEFAKDNKSYLENEIGGTIGSTELYMAHFLGASGAANFLKAARSNPEAKAASLLPEAAAANRSVFYAANGSPLSVGQIYDRFAAKMEGKGIDIPDGTQAQPAMLAAVSDTLNRIPDLKLPTSTLTLAQANMPSGSTTSLANGATASSLFSVMVLSQLDGLGNNDKADDKNKGYHNSLPTQAAALA